jgi:DNA polymerase IIIc chi subunit
MTRIDFAFGAPDRLRMACQVVRKRYLAGQRLVVYCREGSRLAQFDRMLWASTTPRSCRMCWPMIRWRPRRPSS